jgi:hypothetical protein
LFLAPRRLFSNDDTIFIAPRLSIAAAVLMASSLSAAAQMPIAGSGGLPPIDPLARRHTSLSKGLRKF